MLDEDGSRLRQLDTAARSIEEFDAELPLELPDLLAEGGLGDVFAFGDTAKMQLRRQGSRKPQLAKLHSEPRRTGPPLRLGSLLDAARTTARRVRFPAFGTRLVHDLL